MVAINLNFRAADFDPAQGGGSLPVGTHPAVVKNSKVDPTKDGNGGKLVLEIEIIDGPNKGATGNWNLNLWNQSEQAVRMAHRDLSALCHVIGVPEIQNETSVLHNRPFCIVVSQQLPPNDKYTQITKVLDIQGQEPARGQFNGAAPQQPGQPPQGFAQPQQQAAAPQAQPPAPAPQASQWAQNPPAAAPAPSASPWQQNASAPAPAPAGGGMPWMTK